MVQGEFSRADQHRTLQIELASMTGAFKMGIIFDCNCTAQVSAQSRDGIQTALVPEQPGPNLRYRSDAARQLALRYIERNSGGNLRWLLVAHKFQHAPQCEQS